MQKVKEVFEFNLDQNPSLPTFLNSETKLFDHFIQQSLVAFKECGLLFNNDNDDKVAINQKQNKQIYDKNMIQIQNLFNTYCILKKQYSQQKEIKSNVATEEFYNCNLRKRMFNYLKNYWQYESYLRRKLDFSTASIQRNSLRRMLKGWFSEVQIQNRLAIKNQCLKRTDTEISKIQKEYESIIANLDNVLKTKMEELKKEEDEHKVLLEKYENMVVEKKKLQQ